MSTSKVDDPVKTAAGDEAQDKPLLDQKAETDDKEKVVDKEATIPASEAFWNMWRLARWMMVNALLHPIYSIVNAMVLGH